MAYWVRAEIVAAATDVAEIIGGATALYLLFGTPMLLGGVIVGVVSLGLLLLQRGRSQRTFESVIVAFLLVITVGFLAGLFVTGLSLGEMANGILPRFQGAHTVVLAASMLGATVMPHAVYLHSGLVRRIVTIISALLIIASGVEPTWALVLSQVVLSIGIPFALVPLVHMTSSRVEMGIWANTPLLRRVAWVICGLIIAPNVALVVLVLMGKG